MIIVFSCLLSLLEVIFKSLNIDSSLFILISQCNMKSLLKLLQMINPFVSSHVIKSHFLKDSKFIVSLLL
jgi:hypothetical protein